MNRRLSLFRSVIVLFCLMGAARADELTVFAAASLVDLGAALGADFEERTGEKVRIVAGASSTMARQIEKGAPADMFLSANRFWAGHVARRDDFSEPEILFGNRLVLVTGLQFGTAPELADLPQVLGGGHLAMGDPAHVPAGQYAKEALMNAGVWDALLPKIVPASDVRSAIGFVLSGAAEFGIVYATDVRGDGLGVVEIDAGLYSQPFYYAVSRAVETESGAAFTAYLKSAEAEKIIVGMGFVPLVQ